MFLHRGVELAGDDDLGGGQGGIRVTQAQVNAVADVARPVIVQLHRVRVQSFFGRGQRRQVFIHHAYQSRSGGGRLGRLGHHGAYLVALEAH